MKADIQDLSATFDDMKTATLTIKVNKYAAKDLPTLDKPCTVEIIRKKKKRSLNANSYSWLVCDKIAQVLGVSRVDIYRKAIYDLKIGKIGVFKADAYKDLKRAWESNGLGWQTEVVGTKNGNIEVLLYYGSSVFNSEEMSRLIQWLVDEAEGLDIDVLTPNERSMLIERWGK